MTALTDHLAPGVELVLWGRDYGNFSAVSGDFRSGVRFAEEHFGARILLLRVGMQSDKCVNFAELGDTPHEIVGQMGSIRMEYIADVGYMPIDPNNPYRRIVFAILNADCPAILGLDRDARGRVVGVWFAHAGLAECLLPKVADGASVLDTIQMQRAAMGHIGQGNSIEFFLGGGALPCCYGLDDVTDVRTRLHDRYGALRIVNDILAGTPVYGPRKFNAKTMVPNFAVDLRKLFIAELDRVFRCGGDVSRLPQHTVSDVCTTCLGDDDHTGEGTAWSHMWHGGKDMTPANPRNFTCFVWTPNV